MVEKWRVNKLQKEKKIVVKIPTSVWKCALITFETKRMTSFLLYSEATFGWIVHIISWAICSAIGQSLASTNDGSRLDEDDEENKEGEGDTVFWIFSINVKAETFNSLKRS